jgi:hypothetical protein
MRWSIAVLLLHGACAGEAGEVELPDNYREQLHAVTGHELSECTDLRSGEAVITITDTGFVPECAIVTGSQSISIVNQLEMNDTWIVADPPTDLELARHTRGIYEVEAASTTVVDRIGERVGTGVWVCYGRESRHQCQLVVAP